MTYVVCQTGNCAQTYPISYFTKGAKNVPCEECGGVLVDSDGRGNLSRHADVRRFITVEDLDKQNKSELKKKYAKLKRLQDDIAELEYKLY